jgi:hypothetical protein
MVRIFIVENTKEAVSDAHLPMWFIYVRTIVGENRDF